MTLDALVTIYIPTHNRAHLLADCIYSCLNQSYRNIELIIVDDCSTDNTKDVCEQLSQQDTRLTYLRNEQTLGAPASRNRAIQHANGRFVTGLDDDDMMEPWRIQDFINNYDDSYSFLSSTATRITPAGKITDTTKTHTLQFSDLKNKNAVGNQIFIRKDRILDIGGFDESFKAWQDYDLWFRLANRYGTVLKLGNHSTIVNQQHDSARITGQDNGSEGYSAFIEKHRSLLSEKNINRLKVIDLGNRKVKHSFKDIVSLGREYGNYSLLFQQYLLGSFPTLVIKLQQAAAKLNNRT